MASALHIYPSPFTHESRILKETQSLGESGLFSPIFIGALWDDDLPEREDLDRHRSVWRVRLRARRLPGTVGKLLRFAEWYARLLLHFRKTPPDFINCHSLSVLPLGAMFRVFFGSRIIYDTHELETETQTTVGFRKILSKAVERLLIPRVEAVIVVSESIRTWYRQTYEIDEVHVVRNIPSGSAARSGANPMLRESLGLKSDDILFLCQGLLDGGRGITIILDAFSRAPPNRHVVFLGYGPLVEEVQRWASQYPNIHYHPAVHPNAVLGYTAGANVGLSLIENTCLSYYYSLPNKVFEYILSGVPVIVSDFPEMASLVDTLGCGWKSPVDAEALRSLVTSLSRAEIAGRAELANQALSRVSWSAEEALLVALYRRLLTRAPDERHVLRKPASTD